MRKARAIAIQMHPFALALDSFKNSMHAVADFMYGTPERTRYTYWFAFALFALGMSLQLSEGPLGLQVCAQ